MDEFDRDIQWLYWKSCLPTISSPQQVSLFLFTLTLSIPGGGGGAIFHLFGIFMQTPIGRSKYIVLDLTFQILDTYLILNICPIDIHMIVHGENCSIFFWLFTKWYFSFRQPFLVISLCNLFRIMLDGLRDLENDCCKFMVYESLLLTFSYFR